VAASPDAPDGVPCRAAFVVLAGGSGSRVGAPVNKVYLPLAGRSVLAWSFAWARQVAAVTRFVLVVRADDLVTARDVVAREVAGLDVDVVVGGATRHASEVAALDHLAPAVERGELDVIALHDGARPLARPDLVRRVVATAAAVGGAVPAVPAEGLLPVDAAGEPAVPAEDAGAGLPEDAAAGGGPLRLARVQTPQAFRAADLLTAYRAAARDGFQGTDTASCLEAYSPLEVHVVPGSRHNLKVTFPHDLLLAAELLGAGSAPG